MLSTNPTTSKTPPNSAIGRSKTDQFSFEPVSLQVRRNLSQQSTTGGLQVPKYLITNRAPENFTPSPGAFAAWTDWFEDLGAHLEDRGNPVFKRTSLGNCGPETVLGGY